MRLYLCSYRIPNAEELFKLVNKKPEQISVAVIPNAKDYYADRARQFKINQTNEYLSSFGLRPQTVDLKNYEDPKDINNELQKHDLIWVSGGNTFCLRHQMRRSGFEKIIKDLLNEDLIVYAGESAGACAAGNSLKGFETADEPEFAEEIIWEGLNILPNFILPHTDNPMFAGDIEYARQFYKDDPSVIELTDSQAFIVDGAQKRIVEKPSA